MKNIEVIVSTDGTLKINAVGFSGPDCEKATRFLEEALGRPSRASDVANTGQLTLPGLAA